MVEIERREDVESDQPSPSVQSVPILRQRITEEGVIIDIGLYRGDSEQRTKLRHDRVFETGQPSTVDPPQTSVAQVTTSTTPSHALGRSIEEVAVDLVAQVHNQPSHSHISQMWVSDIHGEEPHNLSSPHLEDQDIENRGEQPHSSPSFNAQVSLEPIGTFFSVPRTQETQSATAGGLSDPARTPIVFPPLGGIQGLGGSPTIDTITPAMNVGSSAVDATVVASTGNLSGPGMIFPEFVSKAYLDKAL